MGTHVGDDCADFDIGNCFAACCGRFALCAQ